MNGELFREAPNNDRYPVKMYYRLLAPQLLLIRFQDFGRMIWVDHSFAAAAHAGKTESESFMIFYGDGYESIGFIL